MPIEKVVDRPSAASRKRGMTAKAAANRRIHYLAANDGRENVEMVDVDGRKLDLPDAVERLGGKKAPYTEVVSAASILESKCLSARRPDLTEEEAMKRHFAAQARILDPSGMAVVAVHKSSDGSFHAHILIPGKEAPGMRGPHGKAIKAWDQAWDKDKALPAPIDYSKVREAKRLQDEFRALRTEMASVRKDQKAVMDAVTDPAIRISLRRDYGQRLADLEVRLNAIQTRKLEAFYAARGCSGSLEHLVELQREEFRHRGEIRKVEREEYGRLIQGARRITNREHFRHLDAQGRLPIRTNALEAELEVIRQKQAFELENIRPEDHVCDELRDRHAAEIEAALLRFESNKLRDREADLARQGGVDSSWTNKLRDQLGLKRKYTKRSLPRWASTYEDRKALMAERHSIECQALQKWAETTGRASPNPRQAQALEKRQALERKALALEPAKLGMQHVKGQVRGATRNATRKTVALPGQALKKLREVAKKAEGRHPSKAVEELERGGQVAESTAISVASSGTKVATTIASETAKAAIHQARHAGQACVVTAKAISAGLINPAAGAKVAAEGYAEVGANSLASASRDAASGVRSTTRDATTATKDMFGQTLASLTFFGLGAAPPELQQAAKTIKEASLATIRTAKNLVTMDFIGAATSAGEGVISTSKEAVGMARGKLPMPMDKVMDLAAKIPVLGISVKAMKVTAEVAMGASKASSAIEIER